MWTDVVYELWGISTRPKEDKNPNPRLVSSPSLPSVVFYTLDRRAPVDRAVDLGVYLPSAEAKNASHPCCSVNTQPSYWACHSKMGTDPCLQSEPAIDQIGSGFLVSQFLRKMTTKKMNPEIWRRQTSDFTRDVGSAWS